MNQCSVMTFTLKRETDFNRGGKKIQETTQLHINI